MGLVATLKTSGTTGATPFGSGSTSSAPVAIAAGALIVVLLLARDSGGAGDIASQLTVSDGTNAYTARVTRGAAGGSKMQGVIWTAPDPAGGSRTLTFDCGANSMGMYEWFIYEVTGQHASPIGASASDAATFPIDGAASLTLSAAPAASSIVLAACGIDGDTTGTVAVTPGAGWTEDGEVGGTSPEGYSQAQQRTGSTSTSVDWVDVRAGTMATFSGVGIALEIIAASTSAPMFRGI